MTLKQKIKKLKEIRAIALQQRRELHQRRFDPLFEKEYKDYGLVIDEANAAILELEDQII